MPLPGIDSQVMSELASQHSSGILGFLDKFSGGALGRQKEHYQWDMNEKTTDLHLPINQTLKDMQKALLQKVGRGVADRSVRTRVAF